MAGIIGEAFVRVRPDLHGFRGDVQRQTRGSLSGVGKVIGAGLGLGFGFEFINQLDKTLDKAKEAEVVNKRLEASLHALNISYEDNATAIEEALQAQSKLSSFDDEELKQSFVQLLRRTDDVNKALELNALAANVARGSGFNLTTVAKALGRAYDGQTAGLTRLGVAVKKGLTGQQALNAVQEKYAGSAAAFASTAEGAQERLNKTLDDSREIIGGALLPIISDLAGRFSDYLEKANESGEIQAKVNKIVSDGASIAHSLATAFTTIQRAVGPLVSAVGGLGNVLQIALGLKIASLVRAGVGSFGVLGASVTRTATTGAAEAATFGRAWDVATRPRNMVVTTTVNGPAGGVPGPGGGGPIGGGGRGAGQSRRGPAGTSVRDRINEFGRQGVRADTLLRLGPVAGLIVGSLAVGQAGEQLADATPAYNAKTGQWFFIMTDPSGQQTVTETSEEFIKKNAHEFWVKVEARRARSTPKIPGPDEGTRGPRPDDGKTKPPAGPKGMTRLQGLRLQLAAAERRDDLAAQKRIQGEIVGIFQARVDNTKLTGQALVRFKNELSSEEDRLDAIQDSIASDRQQKAAAAASDRAAKAQAAADRKAKADQKVLDALTKGRRPFAKAVERAAGTAGLNDDVRTAKALKERIEHEIDVVKKSVKDVATKGQELDRLDDERTSAITALNTAKANRRAKLAAAAGDSPGALEKIEKQIELAGLRGDKAGQMAGYDRAIKIQQGRVAKAKRLHKGVTDEQIELQKLINARRDLKGDDAQAGTATTLADLFAKGKDVLSTAGNLRGRGNRFVNDVTGGFDPNRRIEGAVRARMAATGLTLGEVPGNRTQEQQLGELQNIRRLLERGAAVPVTIQNPLPRPTTRGFQEARAARFEREQVFNA